MLLRLTLLVLLLISSVNVFAQSPPAEPKEKSCREHPLLTGRCFTVRGRLSIYNGAPARRIWKVGTKRVLGISEQRFSVAGYRNIPEDIESKIGQDVELFGNFVVCPFTRSRPGEMQLVCIDDGKDLVVKNRQ